MKVPRLTLSEDARSHLPSDLDGRVLRISFTTGCGGSGYRLSTADAPTDGDAVVQIDDVRVALDDMAARNLDGATIVFDEIEGGYLIDHPSAAICAWCG